jgi:hypothetical protein
MMVASLRVARGNKSYIPREVLFDFVPCLTRFTLMPTVYTGRDHSDC